VSSALSIVSLTAFSRTFEGRVLALNPLPPLIAHSIDIIHQCGNPGDCNRVKLRIRASESARTIVEAIPAGSQRTFPEWKPELTEG
jgi:ribosomal protein S28E/S33